MGFSECLMMLRHSSVMRNVLASDSEPEAIFRSFRVSKRGLFIVSPSKLTTTHFLPPLKWFKWISNAVPLSILFILLQTSRKAKRCRFACISFQGKRRDCRQNYVKIIKGFNVNAQEEMGTVQILSECWSGMCLVGILFLAMRRGQASSTASPFLYNTFQTSNEV